MMREIRPPYSPHATSRFQQVSGIKIKDSFVRFSGIFLLNPIQMQFRYILLFDISKPHLKETTCTSSDIETTPIETTKTETTSIAATAIDGISATVPMATATIGTPMKTAAAATGVGVPAGCSIMANCAWSCSR